MSQSTIILQLSVNYGKSILHLDTMSLIDDDLTNAGHKSCVDDIEHPALLQKDSIEYAFSAIPL